MTPNSSLTSYLSVAELKEFYDWRTLADIISDNDVRGSEAAFDANPKVSRYLMRASGMMEAACFVGKRYSTTDLVALTGVSAMMFKGMIADLFVGLVLQRRPDRRDYPPSYQETLAMLENLRSGQRIFSFEETAEAGIPGGHIETATEITDRNGYVSWAHRYWGRRADRRDPHRQ